MFFPSSFHNYSRKGVWLAHYCKNYIFSKNQSYHFVNTIPPAKDSFRPCSVTDSDSKILSQCKSDLNKSATQGTDMKTCTRLNVQYIHITEDVFTMKSYATCSTVYVLRGFGGRLHIYKAENIQSFDKILMC